MEFPGEREAITRVLLYGESYGYGNLISHLQEAWSKKLQREYGFDAEAGNRGAGRICPWCNVDSATGNKVTKKKGRK